MHRIPPPPLGSRRMLLSWTLGLLRRGGIRPSKKLSQSFVVDPRIAGEILEWIKGVGPSRVVEIGAGLGTLTYHLALAAPRVVAIEVDPRLASIAKEVVAPLSNVEVIVADILEFEEDLGDAVVSNVPYHVTGPLLGRVLRDNTVIHAALLLQSEVALKIVARPGTRKYGRISFFVQSLAKARMGGAYPPSSFYPRPRVYSRMIYLERTREYDYCMSRIEDAARCIFSRPNRTAKRAFRECLGSIPASLHGLEGIRVRDLGPEEAINLLVEVGVCNLE